MATQTTLLAILCLLIGLAGGAFAHAWFTRRFVSPRGQPEVSDGLQQLCDRVDSLRREQLVEQTRISEQLRAVVDTNQVLQQNTGRLASALSHTGFRGKWGEAQLRRIVEAAGLMPEVHYQEQLFLVSDEGNLRPDMVINMSDGRQLVIDAKAPVESLIAPHAEVSASAQAAHAKAVGAHIDKLASREYAQQFERSPGMVVMFLPAESLLGIALQADPALLERAFSRGVVLATPSTLLALLRTVGLGWRERDLSENAQQIHLLGKQLYERLLLLNAHLTKVGTQLSAAVGSYNQLVGSYESRVLVSARRMSDLGVGDTQIGELTEIDERTRRLAGVAAHTREPP